MKLKEHRIPFTSVNEIRSVYIYLIRDKVKYFT